MNLLKKRTPHSYVFIVENLQAVKLLRAAILKGIAGEPVVLMIHVATIQ